MNKSIPILTLRLLDEQLPLRPNAMKYYMGQAKDLARAHEHLFREEGLSIDLFHNDRIEYSGIQLGHYQGSPEWIAIGSSAVKTLRRWWQLYREQGGQPLQNTIEIREHYTPEFLNYQQSYQVAPLLINDHLARLFNEKTDAADRCERLGRYLYGNLQTFFRHIGFTYDKEQQYLLVKVQKAVPFPKAMAVYHHQKKTAYKITFSCNFRLPQTLRIGQSTALGYGAVHWIYQDKNKMSFRRHI